MNKRVMVTFQQWHWQCGDECCDEYGTAMLINGKEVLHDVEYDTEGVVRALLESLGITNFEIETK